MPVLRERFDCPTCGEVEGNIVEWDSAESERRFPCAMCGFTTWEERRRINPVTGEEMNDVSGTPLYESYPVSHGCTLVAIRGTGRAC